MTNCVRFSPAFGEEEVCDSGFETGEWHAAVAAKTPRHLFCAHIVMSCRATATNAKPIIKRRCNLPRSCSAPTASLVMLRMIDSRQRAQGRR